MASRFGNKLAINDPDTPNLLKGASVDTLPGSPKGAKVGATPQVNAAPPVRRAGGRTQRASVTGRG